MKEIKHLTMREYPESERPYERCVRYGAASLTDAQLLAVLLRNGTKEDSAISLANRILTNTHMRQQGIRALSDITYETLVAIKGIGRVKAITLLCAVELGKRLALSHLESKLCFTDSASVAGYYQEVMRLYEREHVLLLLLDTKGNLIKEVELSVGTINASLVSTRELLVEAFKYNAVALILLHNHPSGDATPSREDIAVTERVLTACQTVGIHFRDHIVIGSKTYVGIITGGYIPSEIELL